MPLLEQKLEHYLQSPINMTEKQMVKDDEGATSRAGLVLLFFRLVLAATARACTSPFKGSNGAPTYFKDVMFAMIRKKLEIQTIAEYRLLDPLTPEVYRRWTKKHHVESRTEELGHDAQAHWLGDRHADKVIAYFHGGGYTQPLQPGYFDYLQDMINVLTTPIVSVSIVVLSYTLAPTASFPTQLMQGVLLLNHLLGNMRVPASSTILMGDSAGAHLVISLLSHILHPHPDVPKVRLESSFAGAVVISPWVCFDTNAPSYKRNLEKDCLDVAALRRWSKMFRGHTKGFDNYLEPMKADASWWKDAGSVVGQAFIWAGKNEIFVDDIETFANIMESAWDNGNFELFVAPKQAHCQPIVDFLIKDKVKSEGALRVERWLKILID